MFLYLLFLSKDKTGMITVWNYSHYKTDYIATWKRDFFRMLFNPNQKVTATEMKATNQYRHIFRKKKMENSSNSFAIITNFQSYLYKQLSTTFMVLGTMLIKKTSLTWIYSFENWWFCTVFRIDDSIVKLL